MKSEFLKLSRKACGPYSHFAHHGAYVDDCAALARGHVWDDCLGGSDDPEDICVEGLLDAFNVDLGDRTFNIRVNTGISTLKTEGNLLEHVMPALLTRISMRPSFSMISFTAALILASSVTSTRSRSMFGWTRLAMASVLRAVA